MKLTLTRGVMLGALIAGLSTTSVAQTFQKQKAGTKELSYKYPLGSAKLYRANGKQWTMNGVTVNPAAANKSVKFLYRAYRPPLLAFKKPGVKVQLRVMAQVSSKPFPAGLSRMANLKLGGKHGIVHRQGVGTTSVRTFAVDFGKPVFKVNRRYYVRVIPVWIGYGKGVKARYIGTASNAIKVHYGHVLMVNPKDLILIPKKKPTPPPVEIPGKLGGIKRLR